MGRFKGDSVLKIYAVRNKLTKLFLSKGKSRTQTAASFSNKPRLFTTSSGAKNAMNAWSKGIWQIGYTNTLEGPEYGGPEPPKNKPEDRKLEELEVVTSNEVIWND